MNRYTIAAPLRTAVVHGVVLAVLAYIPTTGLAQTCTDCTQ